MSHLKSMLILYRQNFATINQVYYRINDLAAHYGWELTLTWIPEEHLDGFGTYIRTLFPIDNLIHLGSGPISEHEKQTIVAIRDWYDQRDEAKKASLPAMAGASDPATH